MSVDLGISRAREEAIRQEIRAKIKNRKRSGPSDGHNKKVAKILLAKMNRRDNYSNEDLGVILEVQGLKYSSVGPATTWMVREEYLDRVARGTYRKLRDYEE